MEPTSPPWLPPGATESQPEGMLRISDGQSFQVIWPVHLAGWLAMGWQLDWPKPAGAGPAPGQDSAGTQVGPVITALLGARSMPRLNSPIGPCCREAALPRT